jgi:hypothetical protein
VRTAWEGRVSLPARKISEVTTVIWNVCTRVVKVFASIMCDGEGGSECKQLCSTSVCYYMCTLLSDGAGRASGVSASSHDGAMTSFRLFLSITTGTSRQRQHHQAATGQRERAMNVKTRSTRSKSEWNIAHQRLADFLDARMSVFGPLKSAVRRLPRLCTAELAWSGRCALTVL